MDIPRRRRKLLGAGVATALAVATLIAPGLTSAATADTIAANTNTAIGAKPMMGFNNWARFQCTPQARLDGTTSGYSFQQFMQDQAKAMSDTGLVAAGYTNLTVDDCWMQRSSAGYLHGAATWNRYSTQPGFDWELNNYANYVHSLGMQAGLYNSSNVNTCQGVAGGVPGHEQDDANSLVYWGIDSLKLDNCGSVSQTEFTTMANALGTATQNTSRKILFNESAPAGAYPNDYHKYETMNWVRGLGQMWRVSPDIATWNGSKASWDYPHGSTGYEGGVYQNFTDTVALARYNGPGNFNDADMLLIGDNGQLTQAEERSQFALWAAMGSPLMISTDVRKMAANPSAYATELGILKNSDIIAVDQDSLGAGGYLASRDNSSATAGIDVVVKPLAGGKRAVTVVNKYPYAVSYTLDLGKLGFGNLGCWRWASDLWAHTGSWVQGSVNIPYIGSHDNAMYTIDPQSCGGATPTGMIQAAQSNFQVTPYCLDAYGGATLNTTVALWDCTGGSNQQWIRQSNGLIASYQNSSLCISGDGSGMRLRTCNTGDSTQIWTYRRSGTLSHSDGTCIDIFGGDVSNRSSTVGTYTCGYYQPNQTWSAPFDTPPPA